MSKKLFSRNSGKLFKPSVRRNFGQAASYANAKSPVRFSFNNFKDTNIFSSSSFRYGDKEALVSTQELNIDYSYFSNHTFFHSAVAKTNEAFDQIINKFPFDGTNKEIESFEDNLTGFEKYVYNEFPKNKGYLNFSGSAALSGGTFLSVNDSAGAEFTSLANARTKNGSQTLDPAGSDFMFQMHLKIPAQINDNQIILQKRSSVSNNVTLALSQSNSSDSALIVFGIQSGSNFNYVTTEAQKGSFFHLTAMYHGSVDQRLKMISFDNNDVKTVVSSSLQVEFPNLRYDGNNLTIGSGSAARMNNESLLFEPKETLSGSIDDLRYFKIIKSDGLIKKERFKSASGQDDLALYFKFNEPYGDYSGNSIALDASGNSFNTSISNFTIDNRLTGSDNPMKSELLSQCPVLFPGFPSVSSLNADLIASGSEYDEYNPNLITKLVPPHYFQEGNQLEDFSETLGKISSQFDNLTNVRSNPFNLTSAQLLVSFLLTWAKFFDEIKLFIDNFSLFFVDYEDMDTVADKLLPALGRNLGIDVPRLFRNSNPSQLFSGVDLEAEAATSAKTLYQIQNLIWRRLLSDSSNLTLSKGTLDSIRSVFRSSGIEPENIFDFREYGGAKKRSLEGSRKEKKDVVWMLDFSGSVDHKNEPVNAQGISLTSPHLKSGYLSGSRLEVGKPEIDGTFVDKNRYYPHGISNDSSDGLFTSGSFNFNGTYLFSARNSHDNLQSLVRLHVTGTVAPSDSEACALNLVNNKQQKKLNLYFKADATPLTTTPVQHMFLTGIDIVDGDLWSINFGRKGTHETLGLQDEYYLRASKFIAGNIVENFYTSSYFDRSLSSVFSNITTSNTSGSFIVIGSQSLGLTAPLGAAFVNDGSDEQKVTYFSGRAGFVNFWSKSTTEDEFESYSKNPNSVGSDDPLINYNFNKTLTGSFERLRLTTSGKQATTGSDSSGNIRIFDFSQNDIHLDATGFESSKQVMNPSYVIYEELDANFDINTAKNKVRVRGLQDSNLLKYHEFASISPNNQTVLSEEVVDDNRFSIDMSVMRGLNENMLTMFSDFKPLDDALGAPNIMFADHYQDLVNLRKMYFENVLEKLDLGKYRELFKWIDNAYSDLVLSLIPRTTNFLGINFVYESHVLERHRFKYLFDEIYLRSLDRNCSGNQSLPSENTLEEESQEGNSNQGDFEGGATYF